MVSDSLVICPECGRQYNAEVLKKCPLCASLALVEAAEGSDTAPMSGPYGPDSAHERKRRKSINRELGPAKVQEYQKRLKREIAEIEYQIWRNNQVEWIDSLEKLSALEIPNNAINKPDQMNLQSSVRPLVAGLGLIASNTAFMRTSLSDISDQLGTDVSNFSDSITPDTSGMDFFGN